MRNLTDFHHARDGGGCANKLFAECSIVPALPGVSCSARALVAAVVESIGAHVDLAIHPWPSSPYPPEPTPRPRQPPWPGGVQRIESECSLADGNAMYPPVPSEATSSGTSRSTAAVCRPWLNDSFRNAQKQPVCCLSSISDPLGRLHCWPDLLRGLCLLELLCLEAIPYIRT